jgi:SAM-dependent methyltransferase
MRNLLDDRPEANVHGHARFVRSFVDPADLDGKDVLDIGCGFGWFALVGLEAGARSFVGVEPSEDDLATARTYVSDQRVSFESAGADALPFADCSFDTVAMWEVLEHLPKHSEPLAFREIARVLRPGGALYLSTPHANVAARLTDPAWWVAGHRHYPREAVAAYARGAGLVVERLELKGGAWQIAHMHNMYVAKWLFRRRPFLEERSLARLDRDWERPGGFAHVLLLCRKPA